MTLQTFLELHLKGMQDCFNLRHFALTIVFKQRLDATMTIDIDTTYLHGEICYSNRIVKKYKEGEKDFVLGCLTHEVTHCLTNQIASLHRTTDLRLKTEEQVTEHLARLLFKLYKQTIKEQNV